MTELSTVARPYAKAAFQFAEAKNDLNGWLKALGRLATLVQDSRVIHFINHPAITPQQVFELLVDLMNSELDDAHKNFLLMLAENDRVLILPAIVGLFEDFIALRNKTIDVEVSLVYPLTEELQIKLKKALEWRLQRTVVLHFHTDKQLIGGAFIRAGDFVIDGSIRSKLQKMHMAMLAG